MQNERCIYIYIYISPSKEVEVEKICLFQSCTLLLVPECKSFRVCLKKQESENFNKQQTNCPIPAPIESPPGSRQGQAIFFFIAVENFLFLFHFWGLPRQSVHSFETKGEFAAVPSSDMYAKLITNWLKEKKYNPISFIKKKKSREKNYETSGKN